MGKLPNLPFECIGIYTMRHPYRDDVDTICVISIKVNIFLNLNNTFNQILITSDKLVMRHLCV